MDEQQDMFCLPWRDAAWRVHLVEGFEALRHDLSVSMNRGWALGRWGIVAPYRSNLPTWYYQIDDIPSGKRLGAFDITLRDCMERVERLYLATKSWHLLPPDECGPEFFDAIRSLIPGFGHGGPIASSLGDVMETL